MRYANPASGAQMQTFLFGGSTDSKNRPISKSRTFKVRAYIHGLSSSGVERGGGVFVKVDVVVCWHECVVTNEGGTPKMRGEALTLHTPPHNTENSQIDIPEEFREEIEAMLDREEEEARVAALGSKGGSMAAGACVRHIGLSR